MISIIVGIGVAIAGLTVLVGTVLALSAGESEVSQPAAEALAEVTGEAAGRAIGSILDVDDGHDDHDDTDYDSD